MFKLLGVISILVFLSSIVMMVVFLILKVVKKDVKYNKNLKISLLALIGSLVVTIFCLVMDDSPSDKEKPITSTEKEVVKEKKIVEKKVEEKKEIIKKEKYTSELKADISKIVDKDKGTVFVTINANTPDGAIFETTLLTGNLDMLTDNIVIKNGVGKHLFTIPKEWGITYITGISMFRFNAEDIKQPEEVIKLYGEHGEKMKGSLAVANHLEGYNGNLKIEPFGFPSAEAVEKENAKLFNAAMKEIVGMSDGIIIKINRSEDDTIKMVDVVISDSWYHSENYEKERFAEQIASMIKRIYINTGKSKDGKEVMVYFVDSYGKSLASPKTFGGYKIER